MYISFMAIVLTLIVLAVLYIWLHKHLPWNQPNYKKLEQERQDKFRKYACGYFERKTAERKKDHDEL